MYRAALALPPGLPGSPLRAGHSVVSLCGLRDKHAAMSESSDAAPAGPQDPGVSTPRAPAEGRRGRRLPPTHFLALPVQAPAAHEAIVEVQSSLVEHTPALAQALVDVAAAHFTLGVLCLNQGQLQDAKRLLLNFDWPRGAGEQALPLHVTLSGLSHFRHQVLYLDVLQDVEYERLILLRRMLWEEFREAELVSTEDKAFTPHLTVAKLSAMRGKRKHTSIRKIPPEAYEKLESPVVGSIHLPEVQLCKMQGRLKGQYYPVEATIALP